MQRLTGFWFFAFCLFALVFALHWNAHTYPFHYDDYHSIVHNAVLRDWKQILNFFDDPTNFSVDPKQAMYRPVVLVSYAANYALFGEGAGSFHIFNVGLHGLNAVIVYSLMLQLGISSLASRGVALFFAVHPLTTETVYYISSRSESLMAFGVLVALAGYLRWSSQTRVVWSVISIIGGMTALLSKSVGIVFLPLLFLLEWYNSGIKSIITKYRYFLVCLLICVAYLLKVWGFLSVAVGQPVRSLSVQLLTQIKVWVYYLFLFASPYNLSVEHFFSEVSSLEDVGVILALAFLVSISYLVIFSKGSIPKLGLSWSVVALIPASFVPLIVILNEHRVYLAVIGIGMVTASFWQIFYFRKRKLALATFGVYFVFIQSLSFQRGLVWENEESLWRDAALKSPKSLKSQLRWADSLVKNKDYEGSEAAYLRALDLRPGHVAAGNNLGHLYVEIGEFEKAEDVFSRVIDHDPTVLQARLNLAQLYLGTGRWRDAEIHYREVLRHGEPLGISEKKLGHIALQYQGDAEKAARFFEQAIKKSPDITTWISYGVSLRAIGSYAQSETAYKEAIKLAPEAGDAWYNLGNLYRDTGQLNLAIVAYKKVAQGTNKKLIVLAKEELERLKINVRF